MPIQNNQDEQRPPQPVSSTQMFKLTDEQIAAAMQKKNKSKPTELVHGFVSKMQRGSSDTPVFSTDGGISVSVLLEAIGQFFYLAGFHTEYFFLQLGRMTRTASAFLWNAVSSSLVTVFLSAWTLLKSIFQDFFIPWKAFFSSLGETKSVSSEQDSMRKTFPKNRSVFLDAFTRVLPVLSLLLFLFTVNQVLSYRYSLAVEYNGDIIGYIESENTWERAQGLVRERIVAGDSDAETWTATPQFSITPVSAEALSGASKLADKLIESSSDEIQTATGIRVNGDLMGVAQDGDALQNLLDEAYAPYLEPDNPDHRVEFVQSIELITGVYYTSSIVDTATLINEINATSGLLQIKTIDVIEYDEEVAFTTVEQESDDYYKGVNKTIQTGENGTQHVKAEVTTIDGMEVLRIPQVITPLEEMVPKIVAIGTKEREYSFNNSGGSGVLSFPVPGYSYITTQFGQGGHRGTDICAPHGTTIYACESGTVIEAGWHNSWGNYVKIDHGNGMATLYGHCSALYVSAGESVGRGQSIAAVGSTGNSSGPHCHLELSFNGRLTNPMNYMG